MGHRPGGRPEEAGEHPGCTGVRWLGSHLAPRTVRHPRPAGHTPRGAQGSATSTPKQAWPSGPGHHLAGCPCAVSTSFSPSVGRDVETPQRPPDPPWPYVGLPSCLKQRARPASGRGPSPPAPTKAQRGGETTGRPGTGSRGPGQQSPWLPGRLCVPPGTPQLTVEHSGRSGPTDSPLSTPHPSPGRPTTVTGSVRPPRPTHSGRILRAPQQFPQGPGRPGVTRQGLGGHPGHLEVVASARGLARGLLTSGCHRGRAGSARQGRWSWRSAR